MYNMYNMFNMYNMYNMHICCLNSFTSTDAYKFEKSSGSSYLLFHHRFFSQCPKLLKTSHINCSKSSSRRVDNGYNISPNLFETLGLCVSNRNLTFFLKYALNVATFIPVDVFRWLILNGKSVC
jgi:hypothetical protein